MNQPAVPSVPNQQQSPQGIQINFDGEKLKKEKLFVGTPMYGGMCGGMFARSIADLAAICLYHQIQLQLHFLFNESLITRARNYIADEFMRSNSDHLMFIDSDIGFDAKDVVAMIALKAEHPEYDILGGPYPKKTISWEKVKQAVEKGLAKDNPNDLEKYVGDFVLNPKDGQQQIPIFQPVEVREIGTGFMMISRNSFERFDQAYPHYKYRPDHVRSQHFDGSREITQYFQAEIDGVDFAAEYKAIIDKILKDPQDPKLVDKTTKKLAELQERADKKSKRYLSEDYWFNQKCHDIGIRTFICPWMKLTHAGTYLFSGSLLDLAQAGAQATADPALIGKAGIQQQKVA